MKFGKRLDTLESNTRVREYGVVRHTTTYIRSLR